MFEQIQEQRGLPLVLRVDNGPEFLGEIFITWTKRHGMNIQYIQPGKPNQNAYIERFNRTFRDELLDIYLFSSLDEVRELTHRWIIDYNEHRPHDSLGKRTPLECFINHAVYLTGKLTIHGSGVRRENDPPDRFLIRLTPSLPLARGHWQARLSPSLPRPRTALRFPAPNCLRLR